MPVKPPSLQAKSRVLRIEARREDYERWYKTKRWQDVRAKQLQKHPLCSECELHGKITEATQVDHVRSHRGDEKLMWDETNLRSLCISCHSQKTWEETLGPPSQYLYPSDLPYSSKPLTVVCGPPKAGKSTYIEASKGPGDLVLGVNELLKDKKALYVAAKTRNELLRLFCSGQTPHKACWLETLAGSFKNRLHWQRLGATVKVIHPGRDELLPRLTDEERKIYDDWS